jgi:lipoprotein-anchoring transpeptidase ErfK/SrfK
MMPFRPLLSFAASAVLLACLAQGAAAQYGPGGYRGDPNADPAYDPREGRTYQRTPLPYERSPYDRGPIAQEPLPAPNYGPRPAYGAPAYPPYANRGPADDDAYDPQQGYNPHQGYPAQQGALPQTGYGAQDSFGARRYEPGPAVTGGVIRPPVDIVPGGRPGTLASLPVEDQPETGEPKELPAQFKRQTVPYATKEPAGSIIIDTQNTYLYYVLGGGQAIRYGIGVGRDGFTWAGVEKISRLAEWPDWHPPAEMIERQPYLPRFMAGGPGNPLGARALYLGKTVYRIHGTNQPSTIGQFVSSGCIRLLNEDVEDLYTRVKVGTKVVVLPGSAPAQAGVPGPVTPTASNAPVVR